ncbi:restriction endonuclease subunit S [Schlesneria sp. DSM 10557]|uniref:restriction endonuclease subunit S n=1 Tax=Schlesneria sp. DSM 10557 TaxID=3044399 RepID=UPI00359F7FA0
MWTKKAMPRAWDIVLSRRCNPGETALVAPGEEFAVGQNLVLLRSDGTTVHPPFLRWLTRSPDWWAQIQKYLNVGAVFESLKCADVPNFELVIPPKEDQEAIAELLGSLDDKIEQNRRTGAKLEELARAVFKAWFVDFEPVKAKAAGATTFPGMPPEIFAALPASFEDSELGPVPRGWETTRWGEIASLEYGKSLKGYQNGEGSVQVFGTNGPIGWHTAKLADGPGIVIGRKGAYRGVHFSPEPFWTIDTAFYLNPKKLFSWRWAYYELLRVDINSIDSGSAIPSTSREDFYSLPVCLAGQSMFHGFDDVLAPVFEMLVAMKAESDKLAALRDYLLPFLLSGRVRVIDQQT